MIIGYFGIPYFVLTCDGNNSQERKTLKKNLLNFIAIDNKKTTSNLCFKLNSNK